MTRWLFAIRLLVSRIFGKRQTHRRDALPKARGTLVSSERELLTAPNPPCGKPPLYSTFSQTRSGPALVVVPLPVSEEREKVVEAAELHQGEVDAHDELALRESTSKRHDVENRDDLVVEGPNADTAPTATLRTPVDADESEDPGLFEGGKAQSGTASSSATGLSLGCLDAGADEAKLSEPTSENDGITPSVAGELNSRQLSPPNLGEGVSTAENGVVAPQESAQTSRTIAKGDEPAALDFSNVAPGSAITSAMSKKAKPRVIVARQSVGMARRRGAGPRVAAVGRVAGIHRRTVVAKFGDVAFEVGGASFDPGPPYRAWGSGIVSYFWDTNDLGTVHLAVSPAVFSAIAMDAGITVEGVTPAGDFAETVAGVYRRLLQRGLGLDDMLACDISGIPLALPFVALTVLAAYEMRSDGSVGAPAYYARLAELLGYSTSARVLPGLTREGFESAWLFVDEWSRRRFGKPVALASSQFTSVPYIGIPLAHVPLRRVDVDRLHTFFCWADYEPNSSIDQERLLNDISRWNHGAGGLTKAGRIALQDPARKDAVLDQVASELHAWDGSVFETRTSSQTVTAEIRFDIVVRRPYFYLIVRRLPSFPTEFCANNGRSLFSNDDMYYDEVPLGGQDGEALYCGFEWIDATTKTAIRRPPSNAVAFGPARSAGLLSRRGLAIGVENAALVHESVVSAARSYLAAVTCEPCNGVTGGDIPEGWVLFPKLRPVASPEPPPELATLAVTRSIEIDPVGGLRAWGNRGYLSAAPPKIVVSGNLSGVAIDINGERVSVDEFGEVLAARDVLSTPGTYTVSVGSRRQNIATVDPFYRGATQRSDLAAVYRYVPLPQGSWSLVGDGIGAISAASLRAPNGTIARSKFSPVWAIANRGGRTPLAIALRFALPSRAPHVSRSARRWAEEIYRAGVRHPKLVARFDVGNDDLAALWNAYFQAARASKRRFKLRAPRRG